MGSYKPFVAKLVMSTQVKSIHSMDQLSVMIMVITQFTDRLPLYAISKRVPSNELGYLISQVILSQIAKWTIYINFKI